ncbi:MAG: hypothetical protein H6738_00215 [Alphaproteobacteria bacterium]|nr:hypothetical protein [Alphaproteobacteria bacterium]MCB9695190.1 hypothetical protein [Alphaproteobacteria bacterium]
MSVSQQQQQQQQPEIERAPQPAPILEPQPANSDVAASLTRSTVVPETPLLTDLALGGVGGGPMDWAAPMMPTADLTKVAELGPGQGATPEKAEEAKPFTQMNINEQMAYMAKLMNDNRKLLDANSVSTDMEQKMAAQVPREIDENSRRKSVASDFGKQAGNLATAMKGVDMNDPKAVEKLRGKLNEEQRHLLGKVQAGELDLSTLNSKDPKVKAANQEKLANIGIELRSNQYGEMEALRKREAAGEKLTKDEKKRFAELKAKPAYMAGAKGMGSVWGMSKERFGEIYAAGNTRFEAKHYQKLRDSYIKNDAANEKARKAYEKDPKNNKPPKDTVLAGSGIGNFDISKAGQDKIKGDGNFDIIGDIATSYGAGQVMGGYAKSDYWLGRSAKAERLQPITLPDGTEYTPTFADVKNSGRTHDPDANDLKIQMSLVKMGLGKRASKYDPEGKGLGTTMTNHDYITMYNGHKPGDQVYQQYMDSLTTNGPIYEAEKKKLLDAQKTPSPPGTVKRG